MLQLLDFKMDLESHRKDKIEKVFESFRKQGLERHRA